MPHFRQTNIFDETNQNQIISEIAFPRNKSTMGFKLISNLILLMVHDLNRGTKGWDEKSNEGKNSKEEKSEGLKIQRTKVLQGNEIIWVWGTQDWGTKETQHIEVCATWPVLCKSKVSMTSLCSTTAPNCCTSQSKDKYCVY